MTKLLAGGAGASTRCSRSTIPGHWRDEGHWAAGRTVPEDVAVVGAGEIALGDLLRVSLTTVSWSRDEMGRRAAELIRNPSNPSRRGRHSGLWLTLSCSRASEP